MIELLLKFQNLFFILFLCAKFSIFVDTSSKGGSYSTSSEIVNTEEKDLKEYHKPYSEKEQELMLKLKELKNSLDFKNLKVNNTKEKKKDKTKSTEIIQVRLMYVFEHTYNAVKNLSVQQLLNSEINLKNDSPILTKYQKAQKWYSMLMNDIFSHRRGLYCLTQNISGLVINHSSIEKPDYVDQFRFVGKMIAYGIHKQLKPNSVHLGRIFLKTVLQRKIQLVDVEASDPEFYNHLMNVKKNPRKLFFTLNGKPLKTNGAFIGVTSSNVDDYINLAIDYKYITSVSKQVEAFLDGFKMLIPLEYLHYFKPSDLEILLYGIPIIDINDWLNCMSVVVYPKMNTHAHFYIEDFEEILIFRFKNEERLKLLYFITGTTRFKVDKQRKLVSGKIFEIYINLDENHQSFPKMKQKLLPMTNITAKRLYLPHDGHANNLFDKIKEAIKNSEPFQ